MKKMTETKKNFAGDNWLEGLGEDHLGPERRFKEFIALMGQGDLKGLNKELERRKTKNA